MLEKGLIGLTIISVEHAYASELDLLELLAKYAQKIRNAEWDFDESEIGTYMKGFPFCLFFICL